MKHLMLGAVSTLIVTGCGAATSLGVPGASRGGGGDEEPSSQPQVAASEEPDGEADDPQANQPELTPEQAAMRDELVDGSEYVSDILEAESIDLLGVSMPERLGKTLRQCVDAADGLAESGVSGDHYIRVTYVTTEDVVQYDYGSYARLSDIAGSCEAAYEKLWDDHMAAFEPVVEAFDLLSREYDEEAGSHPGDDVDYFTAMQQCPKRVDLIDKVFALPDDHEVTIPGLVAFELGELEDQLCGRLELIVQEFREGEKRRAEAARLAELAPYEEALSGEKWNLFWNRGMEDSKIRTRGGRLLDSPRAFARATVWCETLSDRNVVPEQWITRCFKFRGNSLVDTQERRGTGSRPPSSAYR